MTPFTDIVDWWEKDDVQRQMRSKIKRHLRASGVGPRGREPRFGHPGSHQGADGQVTAVETSAVTWGETELSYTILRSARRKKTVAVTVDPAGSILVVAPERVATDRLDTIVTRKAEWLVRRIRRAESHGPLLLPREFVSGESVRYLGRHYRLKVNAGTTGSAKLRGGWLHVPAPGGSQDAAHVRAALVSWFRRRAAERLPERVEAWHARAGVPMPRMIVASQQKRWGSCDHSGTIRLNWRIIQAPMRLVDYVVVHELVHLRHRGHGRDYWQAVGRVMPDYERRRRDLRERGAFLVW